MKFKYKITLQDYINFNNFAKKNLFSTIMKIPFYIVFVIAILTLNIVLIIFGLIYFAILLYERRMYKTYYYSKKDFKEEIELEIKNNKIVEKTILSEITVNIDDLYKIKENKEYYFLYISKFEAIILPKRYISEKQKEKLNTIFYK